MKCRTVLALTTLAAASVIPSSGHGATLGNLTYTPQEFQKAISLFHGANMPGGPTGADSVMMLHGFLIVLGTLDSGKMGSAFHIYDVSNPRAPLLLKTYTSPLTAEMAEWHMVGMSKVGGKDILVCRTVTGISFLDFTDPMNPKDVSKLALPGVNGGDYTNTAWMNSWSWPYVYTGNSGAGVSITDATDPANPVLVKQIPTGQMGNFRIGPVAAAGNYLIVTNMDEAPYRASVLDVSDPKAPALLATTTSPNGAYSSVVIGDMIFGGGDKGNYVFLKWTSASIKVAVAKVIGVDKGAYCTYQDGFGICGQSTDGFHKIDLHDLTNITTVGGGVLTQTEAPGGDFDFATTLGNLVFQGNDHGSGSGLLVHQMAPDTTPPAVVKIYPEDLSARQPLSTRLTVFFSDEIDTDSVSATSLILRKVGGTPIAGVYSHSSTNAISFGPMQPLEANSTYEVVVAAGGVKDLVGNPIASTVTTRFSTGATISGAGGGSGAGTGGGGAVSGSGGATPVGSGGKAGMSSGGGNGSGGGLGSGGAAVTGTGGDVATGTGGAITVVASGGATGTSSGGIGSGPQGSGGLGAGASASGGSAPAAAGSSAGCGCSMPGQGNSTPLVSLGGIGLAIALLAGRSRRGTRRKPIQ